MAEKLIFEVGESGVGDPPGRSRFPLKVHGLRSSGDGDAEIGRKECQGLKEAVIGKRAGKRTGTCRKNIEKTCIFRQKVLACPAKVW